MSKVGIIGDPHEPATHPMYRRFCRDIFEQWGVEEVICIGDIIDWTAITFHAKHPELPGPADEYRLTLNKVKKWEKAFPDMKVCIGNHDARPARKCMNADVPEFLLRRYNDIWQTPDWQWREEFLIDDVYYSHGIGCGGIHPAFNKAKSMGMSVVIGHIHSAAGIKWQCSPRHRFFGMDTGCGVDVDALQFAYGKHFARRPVLGCGVVLDGIPYYEVMPCGPGEKYHKRRA
jgi:predicted phosphodiesterase